MTQRYQRVKHDQLVFARKPARVKQTGTPRCTWATRIRVFTGRASLDSGRACSLGTSIASDGGKQSVAVERNHLLEGILGVGESPELHHVISGVRQIPTHSLTIP